MQWVHSLCPGSSNPWAVIEILDISEEKSAHVKRDNYFHALFRSIDNFSTAMITVNAQRIHFVNFGDTIIVNILQTFYGNMVSNLFCKGSNCLSLQNLLLQFM